MKSLAILSLSALALAGLHEKREALPQGWTRGAKLDESDLIPLRIALTQENLDKLDEYLDAVSHPESKDFGKHWTADQVADAFRPSEYTRKTALDWILSSGVEHERVEFTRGEGWIHVTVNAREAAKLLGSDYYYYHHDSGIKVPGVDAYYVPDSVQSSIDMVIPTLHFDHKTHPYKHDPSLEKRGATQAHKGPGNPGSGFLPKLGDSFPNLQTIYDQLRNCTDYVVPNCLRALYNIPFPATNLQKNPFGIVEYTPQAYIQTDLDKFFANFSNGRDSFLPQRQTTPNTILIDGATVSQTYSLDNNVESNLDLQFGMALVNPITTTLYQVGDNTGTASFNNFLDALDKAYCTYEGGDDPTQDATYPNPGGYQGTEQCGGAPLTKVISTSYGYNEADLTPFYEQRQCSEYAKLGLLGTTFLYSSGDYGVAGNGGQCIDPTTGAYNDGTSGKFNPSFPGGCPYVLSVGATQIPTNGTVTEPEQACETVIYSGGGFSNVFPMPSYQSKAVSSYFKYHNPPYGADRYNNSMKTRGFPDVSANGAKYLVYIDGRIYHVYGTSASSPVFASILTIVNEFRAAIGKSSVGFVNPTFYQHPELFNDIVKGGNQGCGTPGFSAVQGWDPVTGLGTPNTAKLIALYLLLP